MFTGLSSLVDTNCPSLSQFESDSNQSASHIGPSDDGKVQDDCHIRSSDMSESLRTGTSAILSPSNPRRLTNTESRSLASDAQSSASIIYRIQIPQRGTKLLLYGLEEILLLLQKFDKSIRRKLQKKNLLMSIAQRFRTHCPYGHGRIEYNCACGRPMYDDFILGQESLFQTWKELFRSHGSEHTNVRSSTAPSSMSAGASPNTVHS